ncbi:hypothetical protein [Kitasatospora sp. MAP5-34]|uniref:hypothetical protein n=1 Tax=Kitasatospora sp. MAP5-34 TaxID=3035102 RepID=UPI0024748536|nr:hypothetical protein [Kitasatospora sp. MAP5-34]MDH6575838.1 hypothetical protein [Kitasatospora sp. MAP5-34]
MISFRKRVAAIAVVVAMGLGGVAAGTAQAAPESARVSAAAALGGPATVIGPNSVLEVGHAWRSPSGRTALWMQNDGNVVLYHDGVAIWATGTIPNALHLIMQGDGNLVAYSWNYVPLWWSGTDGHPGAYLAIQEDADMTIYSTNRPLWWSNYNPGF